MVEQENNMPECKNPDDITVGKMTKWLDTKIANTPVGPKRCELQSLIRQVHLLAHHLAVGDSW